MRFALKIQAPLLALGVAFLAASTGAGRAADPAYIPQMPAGSRVPLTMMKPIPGAIGAGAVQATRSPAYTPSQQTAVPVLSGANVAANLQVGSHNRVTQLQNGAGNASVVGIIGTNNNIGVLQAGNNLRSNLVVIGAQGLNVGVIQPNGSAPVNMLIARLPNGGLLIKR